MLKLLVEFLLVLNKLAPENFSLFLNNFWALPRDYSNSWTVHIKKIKIDKHIWINISLDPLSPYKTALEDLSMSTENSNGPLRLLRDSGDETTPSFFLLSGFSFTNIQYSQNSRGRAGYFFKSSLPLPPTSQTLRHWRGNHCGDPTYAYS